MSGGSNKSAEAANRMEQERQARIAQTQSAVNRVFDSPGRQAEIDDVVNASRQFHTQDLTLARSGVTGGSTQVDQQKVLGEDYQRGVLEVDRRARATGAGLQAADQDARARLIQLATSGLDATTASRQAAESMRVNLAAGRAAETAERLGDAFVGSRPYVQNSRDDAQRRQSIYDAGRNLYGPSGATAYAYGGRP
jgi:hypothetical protein